MIHTISDRNDLINAFNILKGRDLRMDIVNAVHILKKLELEVRDLYTYYCDLFKDDKEASGFFIELSRQHEANADMIDRELHEIGNNRLLFSDIQFDMEPLVLLIIEIGYKLSSKEPVSLKDALKFGIELEGNSLQYHYRNLIAKSNPELEVLVHRLFNSDKRHFDGLRRLAVTRGFAN